MMLDNPRTNEFGKRYYAAAPLADHPAHDIAWIDLSSDWNKSIRKSYRSLINWGKRNLEMTYVTGEYSEEFDNYRLFHALVAGRITRSIESWNLQWNEIINGRGGLVMGRLNGNLVSTSVFVDGRTISVYWSGVYERSLKLPLAHYALWLSIDHARKRGMKWVELGYIPKQGEASDKECQIGYFKRGFATHILPNNIDPLTDNIEKFRRN